MFMPSVLVALLLLAPAVPTGTPISIKFDVQGVSSENIDLPTSLKTLPAAAAIQTAFCIHVRTEDDSASGMSVKVWIEPGMNEDDGALEGRPRRAGDDDASRHADMQRLFTRALNRALMQNIRGFGQYFVKKCDEPPITREYGYFELDARVPLGLDARHSYCITGFDKRLERVGTRTFYDLAVNEIHGGYSRARFVPIRRSTFGQEALDYIWGLCATHQLDTMMLVTQLRVPQLNEETRSPNAPSF